MTKRRLQLEVFLKDIVTNESFKSFLEVEKHAPDLTYNTPLIIYTFDQLTLGIIDLYQFSKENILYAVCCDMNITSRVDAYITM